MKKLQGLGASAAIYFASNIASAMVPFALLPILTRVLGPQEYGYVTLFTIFCACATAIIGLGIGGAFTRQYYHLDKQQFRVFSGTSVLLIMGITLAAVTLFQPIALLYGDRLALPVLWINHAILSAGALAVCNAWLACTQVRSRPWHYGLFQVSMTLVNVGVSVLLVVSLDMRGMGRVLGQTAAFFVFALIAIYSLWRSGWLVFSLDRGYLRWLLLFGLPIIPHSISGVIISMSDRMVLAHLESASTLGIYAVAAQVSMIMAMAVDSLNKAYVPWLYSRLALDQASVRSSLVGFSYLYFALVLVAAGVLSVLLPPFIVHLAGPEYAAAKNYVPWLLFAGAFTGMYYMVGLYINYAARNKFLSYASGATAIFMPACCYVLIQINGSLGAAQGAFLGQVTLFILTWFFSARAYPMPWFGK
ncbi:hypothetical protein CK486_00150 [Pseudomonas sp. HAR-UPW-AIA-41]|uniref:lipopolysaccharide biosynthesis protein n=1 Tax=Pseudomonas sp. HAR-UPW-AIA-41 TaxID=1985301 RepID=UPI000BB31AAE|nr:oligosaccharide flippase family protein [Pseudomonas sp. HAR-UPW-AIA-41]PAV49229.1 hypothetical protein CK486_00150 [Pseudomonas sp. HAR-UPW-AIA-41]